MVQLGSGDCSRGEEILSAHWFRTTVSISSQELASTKGAADMGVGPTFASARLLQSYPQLARPIFGGLPPPSGVGLGKSLARPVWVLPHDLRQFKIMNLVVYGAEYIRLPWFGIDHGVLTKSQIRGRGETAEDLKFVLFLV